MFDLHAIAARSLKGQIEGVGNIMNLHGGAQLPSHDIAREVIENSGQVKPPSR